MLFRSHHDLIQTTTRGHHPVKARAQAAKRGILSRPAGCTRMRIDRDLNSLNQTPASFRKRPAKHSTILVYGETIIANNTATVSSGGGIYLQQSDLEIKGNCIISGNNAVSGGGIHATSSTIAVHQQWILLFINNKAEEYGGGLHLGINPKLYILKPQ